MTTALQPERRQTKRLATALRPFEIKSVNESERTFEGFASTWAEDLGGDIIHPGAFAKTLTYWRENGIAIPLIDIHSYSSITKVLGSLLDAEEDDKGLWVKQEVDEGDMGSLLMRHIVKRRLNGMSIGYEAVAPEFDDKGRRHLREVRLYETSAVIWPMNTGSTFDPSSIKSLSTELSDEELRLSLETLEAEAKARAEKQAPAKLSPEETEKLRARLISVRLRPLASRTSGQNRATTPRDVSQKDETEREERGARQAL